MEGGTMKKSLTQLCVLVVDDQSESRALLRNILSDIGINQIYEAQDGKTGLAFLDSSFDLIDVIMCDWNMPQMNGIDLLRQIRSTGANTPFMMITGRSDKTSVVEAKSLGVNVYVRKPYSPTQIEAKLRAVVQRMEAA